MDTRAGCLAVLSTEGVLGSLAAMMIREFACDILEIPEAETLTDVLALVAVVVIFLEGITPASYTIDVRAGALFDIGASIVVRVDVIVNVLVDALARTANSAAPDISILADVDTNL